MKRYLILIALLIFSISSNSQVLISLLLGDKLNSEGLEFGLEGGYNWSGIDGLETNNRLATFNLGFYFDINLKNEWNLYTGVLVKSNLGVDELTSNDLSFLKIETYPEQGTYRQRMNTFNIPALVKYEFKNHFYLEAGPQFILVTKAYVEFNSDVEGKNIRIRETNTGNVKRLGAGITGGFGYRLMKGEGITIGIKYYQGLTDVYKSKSGTHVSSFNLKVNIPIGADKKDL